MKKPHKPDLEAPLLHKGEIAEVHKWYRVHLSQGKSGDGSEYHIYLKTGSEKESGPLCIFFSGGGVAYDDYTAEHPIETGKLTAGDGHFYRNNLTPVTQLINIGMGITDLNPKLNPFYDWSFVVITYSTGDFHVGDNEYVYTAEDGSQKTLYFHGYRNFLESMKVAKDVFPEPKKLLIAGDSAGAFAVPALAWEICKDYYPDCYDVTTFSDSALLEREDWKETLASMWNAPTHISSRITGNNLTLDWYRTLCKEFGSDIKYNYGGSKRDFLLSSFRNEVNHHEYITDSNIQDEYERATMTMVKRLKAADRDFGIYFYDIKNVVRPGGGTIHTAIRTPFFFAKRPGGVSLCNWLWERVNMESLL